MTKLNWFQGVCQTLFSYRSMTSGWWIWCQAEGSGEQHWCVCPAHVLMPLVNKREGLFAGRMMYSDQLQIIFSVCAAVDQRGSRSSRSSSSSWQSSKTPFTNHLRTLHWRDNFTICNQFRKVCDELDCRKKCCNSFCCSIDILYILGE